MPKKNQSYQKEILPNRILQQKGIVTRILKDGFGYIQSGDSGVSGKQRSYIFSFGSIENYRGETAKELNLYEGSKVHFDAEGDKVTRLILDEPDQAQSSEKATPSPELKKLPFLLKLLPYPTERR